MYVSPYSASQIASLIAVVKNIVPRVLLRYMCPHTNITNIYVSSYSAAQTASLSAVVKNIVPHAVVRSYEDTYTVV